MADFYLLSGEEAPMFVADCHLGKLAKYLRLLGFDTLYYNSISDDALVALANEKNRVILTRDRALYERRAAPCVLFDSVETRSQLLELMVPLRMHRICRPFSRCLRCNVLLEPLSKEEVVGEVPAKVARYFDTFEICPSCGRIFWHGDHYRHMQSYIDRLLAEARSIES